MPFTEFSGGVSGEQRESTVEISDVIESDIHSDVGHFLRHVKEKKILLLSLIRMFLWPAVIICLMGFLPVADPIRIVLVLGAALPPASTISVLAAEEGGDEILTGNGLVITTAMSVISIPLFTMLVNMLW